MNTALRTTPTAPAGVEALARFDGRQDAIAERGLHGEWATTPDNRGVASSAGS